MRGNWRGGSFTGDPKNVLSKALEMDACFHRGPRLGKKEGRFPRAFDRRDKFFYLGKFL